MSDDLNCPFCGSQNLKSGGDDKFVGVWCLDCQATGPNHYGRFDWNTRADTAAAQVAAAITSAFLNGPILKNYTSEEPSAALILSEYYFKNGFSRSQAANLTAEYLAALATDTQTDALELVRKEAEQAGYERGVREAMDAALGDGEGEWFNHIQAIADLLDNPTPDPDEQTRAQELAFRKTVSS